jgi:hypothetical protein
MPISGISQGLGIGGGATATISGAPGGGGGWENDKSILLDGSNEYATISGSSDLAISGDVTISLWFKPASVPQAFVPPWGSTPPSFAYMFQLTDSHNTGKDRAIGIRGIQGGDDTEAQIVANTYASGWATPWTNTTITVGNWYHVAVIFTSGSAQIYLNGADKGSKSIATNTVSYTATNIGGMRYSSSFYFNGNIDEVAVFDSALSSSDIAAIYPSSGTPTDLKTLGPVGWWRCGDGDTYPTLTDHGSGGNNAAMKNTESSDIVSDVPS